MMPSLKEMSSSKAMWFSFSIEHFSLSVLSGTSTRASLSNIADRDPVSKAERKSTKSAYKACLSFFRQSSISSSHILQAVNVDLPHLNPCCSSGIAAANSRKDARRSFKIDDRTL